MCVIHACVHMCASASSHVCMYRGQNPTSDLPSVPLYLSFLRQLSLGLRDLAILAGPARPGIYHFHTQSCDYRYRLSPLPCLVFMWHTLYPLSHLPSPPVLFLIIAQTYISLQTEFTLHLTSDWQISPRITAQKEKLPRGRPTLPPPLKEGHDEGQTWGKFCHFKIWAATPENK